MFLFRIRRFKWHRNTEDVLTFYLLSKSIMSSIIVNSIKKIQRRSWKWVLVVSNKKCINVHPLYSDWPTLTEFLLMINIDHQLNPSSRDGRNMIPVWICLDQAEWLQGGGRAFGSSGDQRKLLFGLVVRPQTQHHTVKLCSWSWKACRRKGEINEENTVKATQNGNKGGLEPRPRSIENLWLLTFDPHVS